MIHIRPLTLVGLLLMLFAPGLYAQSQQGTAFTYQGALDQGSAPYDGNADMTFALFDAADGGNQVGPTLSFTAANGDPVAVHGGVFDVTLDFGADAFIGAMTDQRFLEVTVDGNVLSPRTAIQNAPYALQSQTAELAYGVPNASIGSAQIVPSEVQQRVAGTCASGSSISAIGPDGSVSCQTAGSGTITGVAAGNGLSGGGTTGNVTLSADTSVVQQRVAGTCPSGSSISAIGPDGSVSCQAAGSGTITGVAAGNGLSGGGTTGNVTLSADTSVVQQRVAGTCPSGSSIDAIGADGTVTCQNVGTGTITGVTAGTGLTGGGTSGAVTMGIADPLTLSGTDVYPSAVATFHNTATSGEGNAVIATNASTDGVAIFGNSTDNGGGVAIEAESHTPGGLAVLAVNEATTGPAEGMIAIGGTAAEGDSTIDGGKGVYGYAPGVNSFGVYGYNSATTGYGSGVYGQAESPAGFGVAGYSGSGVGVYGGTNGGGSAGYFNGNVTVVGTLSKTAGSFQIDDPLDPANKFLYHSFVESPDMKDMYDGIATLDATGQAWVELPDYFEALNQDYRYQLTAIGAPAVSLYIADEVSGNRFRIAGGNPGQRVSWQVTGTRKDAYAEAHRIPVEVDKPANERGKYLYPELFGQPASLAISPQPSAAAKLPAHAPPSVQR